MGLLNKTKWIRSFRLRATYGTGQHLLGALFWLWGIIGLLYNAVTLFGLSGSVGVGTSAYLSATALVWIGGMILFGLGGLMSGSTYEGERPESLAERDVTITN